MNHFLNNLANHRLEHFIHHHPLHVPDHHRLNIQRNQFYRHLQFVFHYSSFRHSFLMNKLNGLVGTFLLHLAKHFNLIIINSPDSTYFFFYNTNILILNFLKIPNL